jgi:hypothetical protein
MEKRDSRTPKLAIVPIRKTVPGRIYQRDLQEFLDLTDKLRLAEIRWQQKKEYLSHALRSGADVEQGFHEAFLSRLVVR